VEAFLDSLINYDKENIHENCLKATRQYMEEEDFNPDTVRKKSVAAAGLCAWVINIVKWYICQKNITFLDYVILLLLSFEQNLLISQYC